MNKIIFTLIVSLFSFSAFAQDHGHRDSGRNDQHQSGRNEQHRNSQEQYNRAKNQHNENFTKSHEFAHHRWSKNSHRAFNRINNFIESHRDPYGNRYFNRRILYSNFDQFNCDGYVAMWSGMVYPVYEDYSLCRIWFEIPSFRGIDDVMMINPKDIIVFNNGSYLYVRDYYRICVQIGF